MTSRYFTMATACLASLIIYTGCDVHEFPDVIPTPPEPPVVEKRELHLMLNTDDMDYYQTIYAGEGSKSRAIEDAPHDIRYIVRIYSADESRRSGSRSVIEYHEETVPDDGAHYELRIPLTLKAGEYDVVAWGDHVPQGTTADFYYDTTDFYEISLLGSADNGYVHKANNPNRIAWRGKTSIIVDDDGAVFIADNPTKEVTSVDMTMKAPMARYHFITTDLEEFVSRHAGVEKAIGLAPGLAPSAPILSDYRVVVRYTGYMPTAYNAYTDKPVDSRLGMSYEGKTTAIDGASAELGYDHVLVNGNATSVQVALDLYRKSDNRLLSSSGVIDVPLIRGKYTLVKGAFLTTSSGSSMGINPGFNGEYNIEIK